ncbi:MAG: YjbQ family protein, partial [Mycobacterium sp.]
MLDIDTSQRRTVDLTDAVRTFCTGHGDGLCNVFVPHATAGVAIIETGAGSDEDLVDTLERLLPRDDRYRHAHGSPGHGADHVLPA